MTMVRYEHRQWTWLPGIGVIAALVAVGIATTSVPTKWSDYTHWIWIVPVVAALPAVVFSSLWTAVDASTLRWHFGPSFWRKSIALTDIAQVEVIRTSFWNGWGIRHTRRGWLYNVAGFDAVRVTTRNGTSVLIGTDDVKRFAAAIRNTANLR